MPQSTDDRTNLLDPETLKRTLRRDSLTVLERLRILEWESVDRRSGIVMLAEEADRLRDQLDALETRLACALKILTEATGDDDEAPRLRP